MVSDYLSWCVFSGSRAQTNVDVFVRLAAFNNGLGGGGRADCNCAFGAFLCWLPKHLVTHRTRALAS